MINYRKKEAHVPSSSLEVKEGSRPLSQHVSMWLKQLIPDNKSTMCDLKPPADVNEEFRIQNIKVTEQVEATPKLVYYQCSAA